MRVSGSHRSFSGTDLGGNSYPQSALARRRKLEFVFYPKSKLRKKSGATLGQLNLALWFQHGYQENNRRAQACDRSHSMQASPTYQEKVSVSRSAVYTRRKQPLVCWRNHSECIRNNSEN